MAGISTGIPGAFNIPLSGFITLRHIQVSRTAYGMDDGPGLYETGNRKYFRI